MASLSKFAHVRIINGSTKYFRPNIGPIKSEDRLRNVLEDKFDAKLVKANLDQISPSKSEWNVTLKKTEIKKSIKEPIVRIVKKPSIEIKTIKVGNYHIISTEEKGVYKIKEKPWLKGNLDNLKAWATEKIQKKEIKKESIPRINFKDFKRYEPMFFDFKTGLLDKKTNKRVDELLPKEIREHGTYNKTTEYESFKDAYNKSQTVKFKFNGKTYFWDERGIKLKDSKGNEVKTHPMQPMITNLEEAKHHLEYLEAEKQVIKKQEKEETQRKEAYEKFEKQIPSEPKFKTIRQILI